MSLPCFISTGSPAKTVPFFGADTEFHLALGITALPEADGSSFGATSFDVKVDTRRRIEPYCDSVIPRLYIASSAAIGRASGFDVASISTTSAIGAGPAAGIAVSFLAHKLERIRSYGNR